MKIAPGISIILMEYQMRKKKKRHHTNYQQLPFEMIRNGFDLIIVRKKRVKSYSVIIKDKKGFYSHIYVKYGCK